MRRYIVILIILMSSTAALEAQQMSVKTNILSDCLLNPNVGIETRLSDKWTLGMSVAYNPFTFSNNKKLHHITIKPEARYWLCSSFAGHFVGVHLMYSHFNAGGVKFPLGLFPSLERHRFQGNLGAVGVLYGYSWMLPSKRWNIEAEIGFGYGYASYDKYKCWRCGSKIGSEKRGVFLPTKLAVSLVYNIK